MFVKLEENKESKKVNEKTPKPTRENSGKDSKAEGEDAEDEESKAEGEGKYLTRWIDWKMNLTRD